MCLGALVVEIQNMAPGTRVSFQFAEKYNEMRAIDAPYPLICSEIQLVDHSRQENHSSTFTVELVDSEAESTGIVQV